MSEKGKNSYGSHPMAAPRKASIFSHLEPPLPPSTSPLQQLTQGTQVWLPVTRACGHMGLGGLWPEKRGDCVCGPREDGEEPEAGARQVVRAQGAGFLRLPTLHCTFTCLLVLHLAHLASRSLPCPQHPELGEEQIARELGNQSAGKRMNGRARRQPLEPVPNPKAGRRWDPWQGGDGGTLPP